MGRLSHGCVDKEFDDVRRLSVCACEHVHRCTYAEWVGLKIGNPELLDSMVTVLNLLRNCLRIFQSWGTVYIPVYEGLPIPANTCHLFDYSCSSGWKWHLVVLICISLNANDVDDLFKCL